MFEKDSLSNDERLAKAQFPFSHRREGPLTVSPAEHTRTSDGAGPID